MFVTNFNYTNEKQAATAVQSLRANYWLAGTGSEFSPMNISNTHDPKTASFYKGSGN